MWGECVKKITDSTGKIHEVATLDCIGPLFENIIGALLGFSGAVTLFFVIFSGFKYMTSGGDPKQLEGARKTLTYAIIGLIVILTSFFILYFISQTTEVDCIKQFGFSNCK